MTAPVFQMNGMSACTTPRSMMSAFSVGRARAAMVCRTCSTITAYTERM